VIENYPDVNLYSDKLKVGTVYGMPDNLDFTAFP
jgi:hypothetical protein